jgi:hypothetical protein
MMKAKYLPRAFPGLLIAVVTGACVLNAGHAAKLIQFVPDATVSSRPTGFTEKQRGVSWVAGREPITEDHFTHLLRNHVNWIVQTPFAWQRHERSPNLELVTDGVLWGETDAGLETTTRLAQRLGIKTLLKPHVWLTDASDGKSWMDIEMESEENWQRWFENYAAFILHYARLAERVGIEGLCVGAELQVTSKLRGRDWRQLIGEVRKVYHGKLTYAANWYKEFEDITFWNELDFIGIQAYFPLADHANPNLEALKLGWQAHYQGIEKIQKQYRKPILFTEIGYRSAPDCAIKPWEWPEFDRQAAEPSGLTAQAACYEAFFQTFWRKDWFAGAYVWKWYPSKTKTVNRRDKDFTPQGKPAEAVMARWYGRAAK